MVKWEYNVTRWKFGNQPELLDKQLPEQLKIFGADGWELVTIHTLSDEGDNQETLFVFKRPLLSDSNR